MDGLRAARAQHLPVSAGNFLGLAALASSMSGAWRWTAPWTRLALRPQGDGVADGAAERPHTASSLASSSPMLVTAAEAAERQRYKVPALTSLTPLDWR
ncbi:hypothetical protein chiPu_0000342 [Chiloscyllium punctatum]|uniref:Uncharacterized protein n=1 Tax=Chiloscyllium punctatum TaxID=137246 RepID=A0A401RUY2_CHIPU|nr:hypothetical protein [Chiloscyllium punctatum]